MIWLGSVWVDVGSDHVKKYFKNPFIFLKNSFDEDFY
jgi:hypothetical protein